MQQTRKIPEFPKTPHEIQKTIELPEVPSTPPSSGKIKEPRTTGTRVYERLEKVLDAVEKPNFASVLYDDDLTFNTSTGTAAGGGMNMTVLGEATMLEDISKVSSQNSKVVNIPEEIVNTTKLEDISRVVSIRGEEKTNDLDNSSTVFNRSEISFQVDSQEQSVRGIKRQIDNIEPGTVKRQKVAGADSDVRTTPGNLNVTDPIVKTPPTSKRKKPIAVLTEMKRTFRKTAKKRSPRKLSLASTPGLKLCLLAPSPNKSSNGKDVPWTVSKRRRGSRLSGQCASVTKPDFGIDEIKVEEEEDDVSPKTARRVQKSVTKNLSLSLRVSSTSSIDVEEFWRELKADEAFSNLKRKRFDGIIANLHNRNRCFVSNNVIHRI